MGFFKENLTLNLATLLWDSRPQSTDLLFSFLRDIKLFKKLQSTDLQRFESLTCDAKGHEMVNLTEMPKTQQSKDRNPGEAAPSVVPSLGLTSVNNRRGMQLGHLL